MQGDCPGCGHPLSEHEVLPIGPGRDDATYLLCPGAIHVAFRLDELDQVQTAPEVDWDQ